MTPNLAIRIENVMIPVFFVDLRGEKGEFDEERYEIRIHDKLTYEMSRRILVHEITHAIVAVCCTSLTEIATKLKDEDQIEELIVEQVGEKLYFVLQENPYLRKYLWGG